MRDLAATLRAEAAFYEQLQDAIGHFQMVQRLYGTATASYVSSSFSLIGSPRSYWRWVANAGKPSSLN